MRARVNRGAKLISPFMGAINILHIVQHYSVLSAGVFFLRWNFKFISRSLHPGERAVKFVTPGQTTTKTAPFSRRVELHNLKLVSTRATWQRWSGWLTGAWLTVVACAVTFAAKPMNPRWRTQWRRRHFAFSTWKQSKRELYVEKKRTDDQIVIKIQIPRIKKQFKNGFSNTSTRPEVWVCVWWWHLSSS